MNKNLYVGNLSFKITDEDLRANFAEAGEVASASIIKDKFTGQSKGFGFVEMKTEEGATQAIQKFNGGVLDGKTITVNSARAAGPAAAASGATIAAGRATAAATSRRKILTGSKGTDRRSCLFLFFILSGCIFSPAINCSLFFQALFFRCRQQKRKAARKNAAATAGSHPLTSTKEKPTSGYRAAQTAARTSGLFRMKSAAAGPLA